MANSIGILYDLGQDLHLNDDIKSLKKIALLYIIPSLFTPKLIKKFLLRVYPEVSDSNYQGLTYKKYVWEPIENEVILVMKEFTKFPKDREVSEVTHFVANQIFLFLAKNKYSIQILLIILENLVFTWQGTINLKKTYEKVLLNKNLSGKEKFELACKNFMSLYTIVKCYGLLTTDEIDNYVDEEPIKEEHIPIHFFLCRIRCHTKKIETTCIQDENGEFVTVYFSRPCSRSSIYYLFLWAMLSFNDLAVQYIWQNYISNTSERYIRISFILSCAIGNFRMSNIVIYLLTKISDAEVKIFFQVRSKIIFEYLFLQLRWQSSFSKVFDVLHRGFHERIYITVLKFMISVVCSDIGEKFCSSIVREFLIKIPSTTKSRFLVDYGTLYYNMLQSLYNNDDLETCSAFLEINGPLNKNNLFSTNLVTILFDMHILSAKFNVTKNIFKFYFKSSLEINEIIRKFFKERAPHVCHKVILYKKFEIFLSFINLCLPFVSLRDVIGLKYDILFIEDGKFIKRFIFMNQRTDDVFQLVEQVLEWCLHTQVLRKNFKNRIKMIKEPQNDEDASEDEDCLENINVYEEVRECISKFQFHFLSRFFKWKLCSSEEIVETRNGLLNDSKFYRIIFRKTNVINSFSLILLLK